MLINGITSLHHGLRTLETPIPESLLKPRNFNPHPYEQYRTSSITLNTIDTYPLDYIGDNSILNVSPSVASPLTDEQVKHPGNGIYRFAFRFLIFKMAFLLLFINTKESERNRCLSMLWVA